MSSCKPTRKDDISLPNAKLPPKPQGLPSYKLPPRPNYLGTPNINNKSTDAPTQREQSKENLRNLGARIISEVKPIALVPPAPKVSMPRCNSAQKIIYPCWWG
jgi:hypothetical protein